MKQIIIFTLKDCPYCKSLKDRLLHANISFIELDVDDNEEIWNEIVKEIKYDFLPTILITDQQKEEGTIFVPTIDYQTEDEIFEIIKNYE